MMRIIRQFIPLVLLALALIIWESAPVHAATFTVINTNDSGPGSLRQAILDANANAGADTIDFNIPGPGPHTIQPLSALPNITDPVIIDGYTQPGASPNTNGPGLGLNTVLKIELDGSNAGAGVDGLHIIAGSSSVRGLVINRFSVSGIRLITNGGNVIEGNFIGTDVSGTTDLGNGEHGVGIVNSPSNSIGGATGEARNVISGNNQDGVTIVLTGSTGNQVQGNFIGTDITGTVDLGNSRTGVVVSQGSSINIIGGTTAEARNIISGNDVRGVSIISIGLSTGNLVRGNFIGTDVTGTVDLGNALTGVVISVASGNTIGGTTAGEGNLISGNDSQGVIIEGPLAGGGSAEDNLVQGNFIGTDLTGTTPLGNAGNGVLFRFGASDNNTIGGSEPGAGNTVGYNGGAGVFISTGSGNGIRRNSIFFNAGLGIDLLPLGGVTPNDVGDGDIGSNNNQNFPVVTSATNNPGSTAIEGTLNSTPNTAFRLEFFSNSACDPSGHGEGKTFLGFTDVTTDGSGNASFMVTFPIAVPAGQFITATATDPDGNTSEFSECELVEATGDTTPPRCEVIGVNPTPPATLTVEVEDSDSGVVSIKVLTLVNATVEIPTSSGNLFNQGDVVSFTPPETSMIPIQGVKIDQTSNSTLMIRVTDNAGNVSECDPVLVSLASQSNGVTRAAFSELPSNDRYLTLYGAYPSAGFVLVTVNDNWFTLLTSARTIDIGSALEEGSANTMTLSAWGADGTVMISDGVPSRASVSKISPRWHSLGRLAAWNEGWRFY